MKAEKKFPDRTFADVLKELHQCGYIKRVTQIDENCFVTKSNLREYDVAQRASEVSNGLWYCNNGVVRWQLGRVNAYLMPSDDIDELQRIRKITADVTGTVAGYSYGSCAARWLKWAFEALPPSEADKCLTGAGHLNYHESIPGRYEGASYYDITSCYWQLLGRLKSPRAYIEYDGSLQHAPLRGAERERWQMLLDTLGAERSARMAVWGVMHGSEDDKFCFQHGRERKAFKLAGHSYAAAALIARSAWELCRRGAEECDCIYSQTDGLFTRSGWPRYWDTLGLQYSIKADGPVDIKFQHSYSWKHGQPTRLYRPEQAYSDIRPRPAAAPREWHTEWL